MAAQNPKLEAQKPKVLETQTKPVVLETDKKPPQHEINKTAVIVGVVGVVALLFMVNAS